jgi:hypothetical protein
MNLRGVLAVGGVLFVGTACQFQDGTCRSIGSSPAIDGDCNISALCDTNGDGQVISGEDESFEYTCDEAGLCTCANEENTTFQDGCAGTGARQFLLMKQECGFDVVLNQAFCEELGGTAEECDALVAD